MVCYYIRNIDDYLLCVLRFCRCNVIKLSLLFLLFAAVIPLFFLLLTAADVEQQIEKNQ